MSSKGASSNSKPDDLPKYAIVPRDPVLAGSEYASNRPEQSVEGFYNAYSLDYFESYYAQYHDFIGSNEHIAMQREITADAKVCVNYAEVKNNTHIGLITCPLPFELSDFTSCCGESYAEFCCYSTFGQTNNTAANAIFLCTIAFIVILAGVAYFVVGRYV